MSVILDKRTGSPIKNVGDGSRVFIFFLFREDMDSGFLLPQE